MFNTAIMRFNSPDTLSPFSLGGLNAYAYCLGDPINLKDPSGYAPLRIFSSRIGSLGSPLLAVGGVKVDNDQTRRGMLSKIADLSRKSLFGRNDHSLSRDLPGRSRISSLAQGDPLQAPFTEKLLKVNDNLMSHSDNTLTPAHAESYIRIATQANKGEISNTTAHLKAANKWLETEGAERVVGTSFNVAGAMLAGAEDKNLYKTGRIFQYTETQSIRRA